MGDSSIVIHKNDCKIVSTSSSDTAEKHWSYVSEWKDSSNPVPMTLGWRAGQWMRLSMR